MIIFLKWTNDSRIFFFVDAASQFVYIFLDLNGFGFVLFSA